MADKVKVSVKLDLDHDLGSHHYQTWQSQLGIAFQLHDVTEQKKKYLAAAANLGEGAAHYLWQKYPSVPAGDTPYDALITLFDEYFGSHRSRSSKLADLFSITQRQGESVQAFRLRLEKDMRACALTASADAADVVAVVGVHLFARGLLAQDVRQRVLELDQGDKPDLGKAVQTAQSVSLAAASAPGRQAPVTEVIFTNATPCKYCGQHHASGKSNCPAAGQTCKSCGKVGHFSRVCRSKRGKGNRGEEQQRKPAASANHCSFETSDTFH